MPWMRYRYRGNKVWIRVDPAGTPHTDDRGLASLRYKPEDERTYSVRLGELAQLDPPEPMQAEAPAAGAAEAPGSAPGAPPSPPRDAIIVYTDGASSGNPGPAGIGVVLSWQGRTREFGRPIGTASNNEAELRAVLEALRAIRRPSLPVIIYTDSTYVIGALVGGNKVRANEDWIHAIQEEMQRFTKLRFEKVEAHRGIPGNEAADRLAKLGSLGQTTGDPPA
jgi:ribonuclease HI